MRIFICDFYRRVCSRLCFVILFTVYSIPSLNASQISNDTTDVLKKGTFLIEQKQFESAKILFLNALKNTPNNAKFHLGHALSEMGLGHDNRAVTSFNTALSLDSSLSEAYRGLGLIFLRSMQFENAAQHFKQTLRLNPDDIETHLWLSEAQMHTQRYQASRQHYEIALSLMKEKLHAHPDSLQLYQTLIEAYLLSGKWNNAIKLTDELKKFDTLRAEQLYQRIVSSRQKHDQQIAFLKHAYQNQRNKPSKAALAFRLGVAYMSVQHYENALTWLERSLSFDPSNTKALNALAVVYLHFKQPQKAIDVLKPILSGLNVSEIVFLNLGHAYLRTKEFNKAISMFQQAIEKNPSVADAYYGLAMAYLSLETNMKTKALVYASLQINLNGELKQISSEKNQTENRYQNIIETLKHAVSIRPDFTEAQFALGMAYLEIRLYAKAIEAFRMSARFKPKEAEYILGLGVAYKKMGHIETAEMHLQKAIHLNPGLAAAHQHLGGIYLSEYNYPEAIKSFMNAKTIQPKDVATIFLLAKLYHITGQKLLFQQMVDELNEINPSLVNRLKKHLKLK